MPSPLLLVALLSAATPGHSPTVSCSPAVERAISTLDDSINRLSNHVDELHDRRARRRLRADLEATTRARAVLRDQACPVEEILVPPPLPPQRPSWAPPPQPSAQLTPPMDDRGFSELLSTVRRQSFDDGRLDVLEMGVRGQCVTSGQVVDLLAPFAFAGNKLSAARVLVPRIVDRAGAFRLFDAMTFETDKRKLKEIIEKVQPDPACCCVEEAPIAQPLPPVPPQAPPRRGDFPGGW